LSVAVVVAVVVASSDEMHG